MQRESSWTGWDHQGSEHLRLHIGSDGVDAASRVEGRHAGAPWQLTYRLQLDVHWRLQRLSARLTDGRECHLSIDGHGQWWRDEQVLLSSLTGCIDIDIAATPFTNTLPIRRLGLSIGESSTLRVALLSVPALTLSIARQRYTRLSSRGWRYEGLDSGFTAQLEVDDQGLVLDYPDTFRRKHGPCMSC
ncbi:transcriptional regulator [Kushneria pakistanensis]|uniref:Transcriptional regulator n=1 Tax=Kushneria pakistanensis TaxID=1508770 RepID=A0ABQ3FGC7_9GAMM|nr:putative glycolipid-binding domain-containing protein [Kushneria pakistanensis]GHC22164.1 transcriptional regulator [Kushneria pakistanensis]